MSQTATTASSRRPPAAPPPSSPAADHDGISDDASSSLPPSDRLDSSVIAAVSTSAVSTSAGEDEDGGSTSSSSSEANGLTPSQRTTAAPRTNYNKKTTSSTSATSTPLVLKNPDGSLVAAFGAEYVQRKPPPSPKYTPSWLDESVATELEYIYSRHEQLFLTLLVLQLLVEAACGGLYVYYAGSIIQEMCFVYAKFLSPSVVHKLFYAAVVVDVLYEFAYFHVKAREDLYFVVLVVVAWVGFGRFLQLPQAGVPAGVLWSRAVACWPTTQTCS
mmetsp:Transcript_12174/g.29523  ORF Transcript_12174/g.29523 Transcript_12174/m.29523 type:complete len:274 (-) Transcript_12174:777-1598(-)|eukprot:CAMPEP_0178989170 /NCGR_PEP_ID=MMETSP0795-20121207/4213_1 /TAXON_ID=88552 /ORGANISM="Amoebophrya sp., Strain Ameob2" /LENGTH=273 /DNA_ID=CAMNT_0020680517 /DNA_START=158 /DNA_END=979 /DNA_ORIENTATION=-